jgi:hypothetical protein
MKIVIVSLILLLSGFTTNTFAQSALPVAYANCVIGWDYNDKDSILKHFNIFIDSVKILEVNGKLRKVTCPELKLKEGERLFEINAVANDGRQSVKVPFKFNFVNKPSTIDPVTNIRIIVTQ